MIKHLWSVLARQSLIDPDTNSLTIIEVLEDLRIDIQLKGNPYMSAYDKEQTNAFPINFELVSTFYRKKRGKAAVVESEIEVVDPTGKSLGDFVNPVEFAPEHYRMRVRGKFNSLGVTKSGVYLFKVYLKEPGTTKRELVSEIPLIVSLYVDGEEIA
jgi:hypothetical protein